jgi:hypothetical protein
VVGRLTAREGSVDELPSRARDSGLEVVETTGFFQVMPPALGFDLHAGTIAASRSRAIDSGVATGDEIDALERALRAAQDGDYDCETTPFYLALTVRTQPA